MGADVGEAGGIGHAGGLAGVGVGPAFAFLEFGGVVVEELVDRDGGENLWPVARDPWPVIFLAARACKD